MPKAVAGPLASEMYGLPTCHEIASRIKVVARTREAKINRPTNLARKRNAGSSRTHVNTNVVAALSFLVVIVAVADKTTCVLWKRPKSPVAFQRCVPRHSLGCKVVVCRGIPFVVPASHTTFGAIPPLWLLSSSLLALAFGLLWGCLFDV